MKKILVVEDRPDCLNWAIKALKGKVEVELAMNLTQATAVLDKGGIDGVICDICFHEYGASVYKIPFIEGEVTDKDSALGFVVRWIAKQGPYRKDLPPDQWFASKVITLMEETMQDSELALSEYHTVSFLGRTSEELREIVTRENLTVAGEVRDYLNKRVDDYVVRYNRSANTGLVPEASVPALGHIIIKRCLEQHLPVSFLSSTRHASHSLTVPIATGLITIGEYYKELSGAKESTTGVDIRTSKGIFAGDYYKTEAYWLECLSML